MDTGLKVHLNRTAFDRTIAQEKQEKGEGRVQKGLGRRNRANKLDSNFT